MADKLMRAQVTILMDGALPEDYIVNTFHFDGDDAGIAPTDAEWGGAVESLLDAFYGTVGPELFPIQAANDAVLKVYDMREPEPRVPFYVGGFGQSTAATDMLPGEVALCCSFAASPLSGAVVARRRGRVYLGPVAIGASEIVNSQRRPTAAVRTALASAATTMLAGTDATPGSLVKWAIYSPTTDASGASIDDSFHDVESGWVDNAFDTQRRRGCAPTGRTTF